MMCKGTSATLAIAWTYGRKGLPEVTNPIDCVRAFLRVASCGSIHADAVAEEWAGRAEVLNAAFDASIDNDEQQSP